MIEGSAYASAERLLATVVGMLMEDAVPVALRRPRTTAVERPESFKLVAADIAILAAAMAVCARRA